MNKASVKDALSEPQYDKFSEYVCRKCSERPGALLTFGIHPYGLSRQAGIRYGKRLRIVGVMENEAAAAAIVRTSQVNHWDNTTLFQPPIGENSQVWPQAVQAAIADAQIPIGSILIASPGAAADILRALETVIRRDNPHIFVIPKVPVSHLTDDFISIQAFLSSLGYSCRLMGIKGAITRMAPIESGQPDDDMVMHAFRSAANK
jgi:hypothetical protein